MGSKILTRGDTCSLGRTNLSHIANLVDKLRCVPNGAGLKSPRLVRTALILLLLPVLVIGATAALAPRVFYDDFLRSWGPGEH